jgi:hypothetical protein
MVNSLSLFAVSACKSSVFFGLVPWYQYLKLDSSCDTLGIHILPTAGTSSDIPLILLAIVDDLLRIAGIVAIGFVIYASIQYITSNGNPEHSGKALSTLINALIGMGIAIVAVTVVSYLGSTFGGK